MPFLLKDLGASLAGTPEAMGSRALRTHVATETAWIVERYLSAGLVVFGKTNTPEWGNHCTTEPSLFGPTVNPWSPIDHAGRIKRRDRQQRWPRAWSPQRRAVTAPARSGCLRRAAGWSDSSRDAAAAPSRRVPAKGMEGLVNVHALTRTVRDSAALLDVIAGQRRRRSLRRSTAEDHIPGGDQRKDPPLNGS